MEEYGIEYKVQKIDENNYLLVPMQCIAEYSIDKMFLSTKNVVVLDNTTNLNETETVIDEIVNAETLKSLYTEDDMDIDFLKEYHFAHEQEYVLFLERKQDTFVRQKVKWNVFKNCTEKEWYTFFNDKPIVALNQSLLNELCSESDLQVIKTKLARYQSSLDALIDRNEKDGITSIEVADGKIVKIDTDRVIVDSQVTPTVTHTKPIENQTSSISVQGLENYINERVLGRENEVKGIASTLIMNYTALEDEDTETILVLGPSGSGKTATFKAASEYLNLPFKIVDCPSLVPQGIVGTSLNDFVVEILEMANGDIEKAKKCILVLDEFDKLSQKNPDFRETVINEFLKFTEGTTINVTKAKKNYSLQTGGISKCFSGVFEYAREQHKTLGFHAQQVKEAEYKKQALADGVHYSKEIIDRISDHMYEYQALSQELKRRILLESKYSIYLKKKKRFARQFHVDIEMDTTYIDALLASIEAQGESMREVNSKIMQSLEIAQYELLQHPTSYKKLQLTKDTVTDSSNFKLY